MNLQNEHTGIKYCVIFLAMHPPLFTITSFGIDFFRLKNMENMKNMRSIIEWIILTYRIPTHFKFHFSIFKNIS